MACSRQPVAETLNQPVSNLETLWVLDPSSLSPEDQMLVLTLQGLVADQPEAIWIADEGINALILEGLEKTGVSVQTAESAWSLLDRFRDVVKGAIVYELETDSVNVATSLCGIERGVAVDASQIDQLDAHQIPIIHDVRSRDELWAFETYQDRFTSQMAVEQTEAKPGHLRDFAVANGLFTYYGLDPEAHLRILNQLGSQPLVFGWGGDEHQWVAQVSEAGGTGIPADWSRNLSVLSQLPVDLPNRPRAYPKPVRKGERIVAFVMSDGDNIQWMGGRFAVDPGFWASPHRGTFNMTWEMAPSLADVAPRVLAYFYDTASTGRHIDDFVTGPSGAGYSYHSYLPDRRAFAGLTAEMMRQSDLSIVTMLNSGGSMKQSAELLERPEVLGVLYKDYAPYNAKEGRIFWHNGKPSVAYRYLLWEPRQANSPEGVAEAIKAMPASPASDQASYALINVHAWSFEEIGGPMEAVKRTIDLLPRNVRVVTAESLIILLRNNFGTPVSEDAIQ
jgi:hypothetical protein